MDLNNQNSSGLKNWREITQVVPAKNVLVVNLDKRPNWYYVNNLSSCELFLSVTGIPSENAYDLKIPPQGQEQTARPVGTDFIRIYNNSAEDALIKIQTDVVEFNPTMLVGSVGASQSGGSGGGGTSDNVTIKSFTASLPAGNNKIGTVDISKMPEIPLKLDSALPPGTNNIGNVKVTSLPALPAGDNHLGTVNINSMPQLPAGSNIIGKVAIDGKIEIKEVVIGQDTTYVTNNSSVTGGGNVISMHNFNMINFLANDGDADLKCEIYKEDKATLGDDIIIKKGESLQDLKIKGYGIKLTVSGGTGTCNYRYLTTNDN
ncbi:hypothetical protein KWL24_019305 [Clostridioides difficile]|uniref:hypothetical protein n=1 Tax=Clostridioides difficile TaxID=1496 RepID=UPI00188BECC8|nr:hypothetical protein [Clostridioides difficile]MBF4710572.1 hypothetical protein [Clostridioides difficile]MBY1443959.1 hypothetical protein [Clostridioides difficile]MBZ0592858.1 hypothetical protein [Clostridioides difficile]MCL6924906.1 hypothetical protein [Clostridioides difficile]MDE3516463.1 hypothetical protein [Clostridioides difficile]